ncbi:MAG: hypothetical protein IPP00_00015 [Actinomycetales bacterium]|uniref:Tetratricopeptide repeat protein n=1 Tax=Candidatus Phosphoribacter hodrii TaxID=2953743 RepID=A0A9D7T9M2_9MICO|nr:hypothetical protein [Candidatus Phosphoribacter hodrii]
MATPSMEAARLAWLALPKDDMDSCAACRIGHQVDYLTETGRFEEAIELGLTQHSSCNLEPTRTLHALALAHLNVGADGPALAAYRRALATLDTSDSDYAPARGQGFEMVARGGHVERALRFLREDHPSCSKAHRRPCSGCGSCWACSPGSRPTSTTATCRPGCAPRRPDLGQITPGFTSRPLSWPVASDARGGTTYYARLLDRSLAATARRCPWTSTSRPWRPSCPQPGAGDRRTSPTPTPAPAALGADGVAAALTIAERHARARSYPEAAAAPAGRRGGHCGGAAEHAGMAWAEPAQCAAQVGDEVTAHARYAAALPCCARPTATPARWRRSSLRGRPWPPGSATPTPS